MKKPAVLLFLLCLFTSLAVASPSFGATWYVSAAGDDANAGSDPAAPLKTIGAAVAKALTDDRINVAAGTYAESVLVQNLSRLSILGGWDAAFAVRNPAAQETTVTGDGTAPVFRYINGTENLLDGFTVRNGNYGIQVESAGPANQPVTLRVDTCTVTASVSYGIYSQGAYLAVDRSRIVANGQDGIAAHGPYETSRADITRNVISDNGAGYGGSGLYLISQLPFRIYNNIIAGNKWAGVLVSYWGATAEVFNNTIIANKGEGVSAGYYKSIRAINNIIAYNGGPGLYNGSSIFSDYNDVFGNTGGDYYKVTPGANDLSINPDLDAANHLKPGSPLVNRGTDLSASFGDDIDGQPRSVAAGGDGVYDIGADEVVIPVIRVDRNAPGPDHDGKSWATAFVTVQEGLSAAAAGQEVWVAKGTYFEHLALPSNVALYGGFDGTETIRERRDWAKNLTILDGSSTGIVVSQFSGGPATRIDGFTIQNGYTQGSVGGGINVDGSSVTIANNIITKNYAGFAGSGIAIYASRATVENNKIIGNTGPNGAGLILMSSGDRSRVVNNLIEGNKADSRGGGILIWEGAQTISGNVFRGNNAYSGGQNIAMIGQGDSPLIVNNTFDGTGSYQNGVAILNASGGHPTLANNIITNFNIGVYNQSSIPVVCQSNGFFGNKANTYGAISAVGDVVADPLYNDRFVGDYHLRPESPFLNIGDNTFVEAGAVDFDREPRIYTGYGAAVVDLGADEFTYPATQLTLSGTQGQNGWYTSDVEVSLPAVDIPGGSGIAGTNYSLDQGLNWISYTAPLLLSSEGPNGFSYRSTTAAGATEPVKAVTIKVDKTAPDTTAVLSGTMGNNDWYRSNVGASFTVVEAASGLAGTDCQVDNPGSLSYCTMGVNQSQEGSFILYYRSRDNAGLVEDLKQISFKIDKTAPVSTLSLAGTQGLNGWYSSNVVVTIASSDNLSGVLRTEFSLDNGASWNAYSAPLTVAAEGTMTISYRAVDVAGNGETARTEAVKIDRTPPVTAAALSGAAGQNGWYVSDVQVTLTPSDGAGSGVARTEYSLDNGATWTPSAGTIVLAAEGISRLQFRSIDNAGLMEAAKTVDIRIDKTAPLTTAALAGTAGDNGWYRSSVQVTLSATDAASGVARTEFSLDNAAWAAYTGPMTVSAAGIHTLQYRSTDAAGITETAKTVSVNIDRTAPRVTVTDPRSGATGVSTGKTISVTFGEAIQAGSAFAGITIMNGSMRISFTPSISGNVLTLDPAANLPRNSQITVTLPSGAVKDMAGNPLASQYRFGFRTGNR